MARGCCFLRFSAILRAFHVGEDPAHVLDRGVVLCGIGLLGDNPNISGDIAQFLPKEAKLQTNE